MWSMKHCLRKTLEHVMFSHDELLTALTEIEMVLNSRLLTCISVDDQEEPLIPSHLLVGWWLMSFPDHLLAIIYNVKGDKEDCRLNICLKHLNHSLDLFCFGGGGDVNICWNCVKHIVSGEPQLSEGDVVVHADDLPCSC